MLNAVLRFSGHQSFALRHSWLTKGVRACAQDPTVFRASDALVRLGVGKNMVEAIKYWCLAARVIEPCAAKRTCYEPTPLGRLLFVGEDAWDPYLEDQGSLWLLHWLMVTNQEMATTAWYAFSYWLGLEFTRVGLANALSVVAEQKGARVASNSIARDVAVFIRNYVGSAGERGESPEDRLDSPLAELKLVSNDAEPNAYVFARGSKDTLPDAVVLYALDAFWASKGHPSTLGFDELAYAPGSPGRVLKLDEPALSERLERLPERTRGTWQLTESAGFRQVVSRQRLDGLEHLRAYYVALERGESHD